MMGDLGGMLGSLAGMVVDPLFWPFALAFAYTGYTRRLIALCCLPIVASGINVYIVLPAWRAMLPGVSLAPDVAKNLAGWIAWALVIGTIAWFVRSLSDRRAKIRGA